MGDLFNTISSSSLEKIHVGLVLTKVLNLVRKHHIQLEGKALCLLSYPVGNYATLVVGTVILEGIGKQLDPTVNLLEEAKPFLWKSELGKELVKESTKDLASSVWQKIKIIFTTTQRVQ